NRQLPYVRIHSAFFQIHYFQAGLDAAAFRKSGYEVVEGRADQRAHGGLRIEQRQVEVVASQRIDSERCHVYASTTCAPATERRISNTRNSVGAAMATPTRQMSWPASIVAGVLLVSSHFTK